MSWGGGGAGRPAGKAKGRSKTPLSPPMPQAPSDAGTVPAAGPAPFDDDPASRSMVDTFQDTLSDVRTAVYVVGRVWTATKSGQVVVRDPHARCVKVLDESARCGRPHCMAVVNSAAGAHVWIGYGQGVIKVYAARTYKEVPGGEIKRHAGAVYALAHQGSSVFSGSADFQVLQWSRDHPFSLVRHMTGHGGGVKALVCHGKVVVSAGDDETLRVWDAATGQNLHRLHAHEGGVTAMIAHREYIWTAGDDERVQVWDRLSFKPVAALHAHHGPVSCLLAAGDEVWSGGCDANICVWNAAPDFDLLRTYTAAHAGFLASLTRVVSQPEVTEIWSAGADKLIHVWGCRGAPIESDEVVRLRDDLHVSQENARAVQEQYMTALKAKDDHIDVLLQKVAKQAEELLVCADIQQDLTAILIEKEKELDGNAENAIREKHGSMVDELERSRVELSATREAVAKYDALQSAFDAERDATIQVSADLAAERTHREHVERRVGELEGVEAQREAAEAELRRTAVELDTAQLRLAELEGVLQESRKEKLRLADELNVLKAEHDATTASLQDKTVSLAAAGDTIATQQLSLAQAQAKIGETAAALTDAGKALARCEARLAERDQTVADLEQALARSNGRLTDRDRAADDHEKTIDEMKAAAAKKDHAAAAAESRLAQAEEMLARHNRMVAEAEAKVVEVQQDVAERDAEVARLTEAGVEKEKMCAELEATLGRTNKLLEESAAELSKLAASEGYQERSRSVAELEAALQEASTLLEEHDGKLSAARDDAAQQRRVAEEQEATRREAEAALEKANTLLAATTAVLDNNTAQSAKMIGARGQTTAALEKRLQTATDALMAKQQHNSDLERELAMMGARVADRDERVAQADTRALEQQKAVDVLEDQVQQLNIVVDLERKDVETLLRDQKALAGVTLDRVDTCVEQAADDGPASPQGDAALSGLLRAEVVKLTHDLQHSADVFERRWRDRARAQPGGYPATRSFTPPTSPAATPLAYREVRILQETARQARAADTAAAVAAAAQYGAAEARAHEAAAAVQFASPTRPARTEAEAGMAAAQHSPPSQAYAEAEAAAAAAQYISPTRLRCFEAEAAAALVQFTTPARLARSLSPVRLTSPAASACAPPDGAAQPPAAAEEAPAADVAALEAALLEKTEELHRMADALAASEKRVAELEDELSQAAAEDAAALCVAQQRVDALEEELRTCKDAGAEQVDAELVRAAAAAQAEADALAAQVARLEEEKNALEDAAKEAKDAVNAWRSVDELSAALDNKDAALQTALAALAEKEGLETAEEATQTEPPSRRGSLARRPSLTILEDYSHTLCKVDTGTGNNTRTPKQSPKQSPTRRRGNSPSRPSGFMEADAESESTQLHAENMRLQAQVRALEERVGKGSGEAAVGWGSPAGASDVGSDVGRADSEEPPTSPPGVARLEQENSALAARFALLSTELDDVRAENVALVARVQRLTEELAPHRSPVRGGSVDASPPSPQEAALAVSAALSVDAAADLQISPFDEADGDVAEPEP